MSGVSSGKSDPRDARVSQGHIRRATPEEQREAQVQALREGRGDVAMQSGWDLAIEEMRAGRIDVA